MPSRSLYYPNIAKGKSKGKLETQFSQFDHAEPQPISLNYGMQAQRYIL